MRAAPIWHDPRCGRGATGQRAVGRVPRNHGPNVTLLAAMTPHGNRRGAGREGADRWGVRASPGNAGAQLQPGQVVILDNLNVHQGPTHPRPIEGAGCRAPLLARPTLRTSLPSSTPSQAQDGAARGRGAHLRRARGRHRHCRLAPSPPRMPPAASPIAATRLRATLMRGALAVLC